MSEELTDEQLEQEALDELESGGEQESPEPDEVEAQPEESPEEELPADEPQDEQPEDNAEQDKPDDIDNGYGFKLSKPIPIKARGMEFNIGTEKELIDLAHKGFDYFKKTQELAEWRKSIDVLSKSGMTLDELQRFADLKGGDKDAVAATLEAYGVDPIYVESEDAKNYQPSKMHSDMPVEIEQIAEDIRSNPEHAEHFKRVSQTLPDDFVNEVASNANLLAHFSDHVKRGLAEKVIPEAIKAQMLNGGRFMDHYSRIGNAMSEQEQPVPAEAPVVEEREPMSNRERELRSKASSPRRGTPKPSFKADADSIWDLSDEEFNNLSIADLE